MVHVAGFSELEAAKCLLLETLRRGIGAAEVLSALQDLEAFRNSLCQVDHLLIQAVERFALSEHHCVSSVEKLLSQVLRIGHGEAKRRVRAAVALGPRSTLGGEPLPSHRPELAAAQAAGDLSSMVVDVIERTLVTVEILAPDQVTRTEQVLVGHGRVFEVGELAKICDRVLDHLDPDGARPRDLAHRERRGLDLTRCRDGMVRVQGRLSPAVGARVKAVLGPLAAPRATLEPGPDGGERVVPDARSSSQRTHDALDEACARLLRSGQVPASGGTPAAVIMTMTCDQLREAAASAGRSGPGNGAGAGAGYVGGADFGSGAPTVETTTGEVLSVREALRLATEAEIATVVTDGTGRPLHLGRTRRLATASQTYALIARDGGCSFPGCTVPPEWCDRHHVIPWATGGRTDVDNLTLLCGYHHGHFVQAGWSVALDTDGLPVWRPPPWHRRREPLLNQRIAERHRALLTGVSGAG